MNILPLVQQKIKELDRREAAIVRERKALKALVQVLSSAEKVVNGQVKNPGTTGFHLSPAARKKIGDAQRKRWALIRGQKKAA